MTVPQIFINGQHIGGSDDLHRLDREGKLRYHYNFLGLLQFDVTSTAKLQQLVARLRKIDGLVEGALVALQDLIGAEHDQPRMASRDARRLHIRELNRHFAGPQSFSGE